MSENECGKEQRIEKSNDIRACKGVLGFSGLRINALLSKAAVVTWPWERTSRVIYQLLRFMPAPCTTHDGKDVSS